MARNDLDVSFMHDELADHYPTPIRKKIGALSDELPVGVVLVGLLLGSSANVPLCSYSV